MARQINVTSASHAPGWTRGIFVPEQAKRLAAPYMQVDVFEDMNAGSPVPERKIDAGQRDSRSGLGDIGQWYLGGHNPAHMGQRCPGSSRGHGWRSSR